MEDLNREKLIQMKNNPRYVKKAMEASSNEELQRVFLDERYEGEKGPG